MRKPHDNEAVICPNSIRQTRVAPEKSYDTKENGKPVTRGIIAKHRHPWQPQGEDCEWSGLPVPVVPKEQVKETLIVLGPATD